MTGTEPHALETGLMDMISGNHQTSSQPTGL
jgi:hypothetical protein